MVISLQWFDEFYQYLQKKFPIPVFPILYNGADIPHLFIEWTSDPVLFDRLTGLIQCHIVTQLDDIGCDHVFLEKLRELLMGPLDLSCGQTYFREENVLRRCDKKIKYLSIQNRFFVKIGGKIVECD